MDLVIPPLMPYMERNVLQAACPKAMLRAIRKNGVLFELMEEVK